MLQSLVHSKPTGIATPPWETIREIRVAQQVHPPKTGPAGGTGVPGTSQQAQKSWTQPQPQLETGTVGEGTPIQEADLEALRAQIEANQEYAKQLKREQELRQLLDIQQQVLGEMAVLRTKLTQHQLHLHGQNL